MDAPIPSQQLMHNSQKVFFAFRTMEENHLRTNGQPDIPHKHEFYTILLVKNACGKHWIDYQEHPMKPGVIFLLSPGQVHQIISNIPPEGDIIMFNDEFLDRNFVSREFITNLGLFSCQTSTPPLELPDENFQRVLAISGEIKLTFEQETDFKFDAIAAYLKLLLIECNKFAVKGIDSNPQSVQSGRPILRNFRQLLETNFAQWHKVNEYAAELNITADYLNNVVKSNVGKTAKELIMDRIIIESKRLGLHTELSSKEIAYQLGYDDPSHFSKLFKNETGIPFSEFRQLLEEKLKRS